MTSDRREFLTNVAAMTAGAILARSHTAGAQTAPPKPRRVDFHHHYQSPGLTEYLNSYGIRVSQFDREPLTRKEWTPAIAIEGLDRNGIDLAYTSCATYFTRMAQLNKLGASIYSADTARRLARETNDYGARVVAM
jgi:hypothetical protein